MKQGKTKIPDGTTTVRNVVTGDKKALTMDYKPKEISPFFLGIIKCVAVAFLISLCGVLEVFQNQYDGCQKCVFIPWARSLGS